MFIDGWPKPASPNFRLKKTKFFKALELQIFWILLYIDLMSNISTLVRKLILMLRSPVRFYKITKIPMSAT
jgi:hypothetical protein